MTETQARQVLTVELPPADVEALGAIRRAGCFSSDADAVRVGLFLLGDRLLGAEMPLSAFELPYGNNMRRLLHPDPPADERQPGLW